MLDDQQRERLRTLTVEVILAVRREYLASGANALTHWDQIQDRMRMATRTTTSPEEWATALCRSLRLPALHSVSCLALLDLANAVRDMKCAPSWLDQCEREYGWIIALARRSAEQARERREQDSGAA